MKYNLNNKTFRIVTNSDHGKVDSNTLFRYKQEGDQVSAEYEGGNILKGNVLAKMEDESMKMMYQCLTTDNELKAGRAVARLSMLQSGKIYMKLDWEWLGENTGKGHSEYIEN
ncbi:MAG TPA: n-acetylglutamate synthase [Catalimonadaceae bacterium]|nr:n-acetylglutamate synthase [Catalimonadaceae bacterium]HPI11147.1 n-acetylglutamate synthase [Catalimonadaceae bacterium]